VRFSKALGNVLLDDELCGEKLWGVASQIFACRLIAPSPHEVGTYVKCVKLTLGVLIECYLRLMPSWPVGRENRRIHNTINAILPIHSYFVMYSRP